MRVDKITRILKLYNSFLEGNEINKIEYMMENDISSRAFDRDIQDIRNFLSDIYSNNEIVFDYYSKSYKYTGDKNFKLNSAVTQALIRILLGCGCFRKDELIGMINQLKLVSEDISTMQLNDLFNYDKKNKYALLKLIGDLELVITRKNIISLVIRSNGEKMVVKPNNLIYLNNEFYLECKLNIEGKKLKINLNDIICFEIIK